MRTESLCENDLTFKTVLIIINNIISLPGKVTCSVELAMWGELKKKYLVVITINRPWYVSSTICSKGDITLRIGLLLSI